jgi:ribonuclease P protein component
LTDSPEFDRVYRQGVAYRGDLFSVHAFPNDLETTRLGLSVSKKVGNAVARNAVRRRLREAFYELLPEISDRVDLVLSARPAAAEASFDDLKAELLRGLEKTRQRLARVGGGR